MTTLTLVRHGTTEWIEQKRLHGISDSPLSERGRREVGLAATALAGQHFDAFYSSPLGRARETAHIISTKIGLEAEPLDDLREMDFGWLEGGRNFDFSKDSPLIRFFRSNWITLISQLTGEGRERFGNRVSQAALEIAKRHPGQHALAVVHMGVRNNILAYLVDRDPAAWVKYDGWPAGAFTEIEVSPDGHARLIQLVVDQHLAPIRSHQ